MVSHRLVAASLCLLACSPSVHETHYGRIEHRVTRADYSSSDKAALLSAAVSREHLDRDRLVRAVLSQNPSLEAARAAWRSALARYHEKDALPDPVLSYSLAPASIFDPDVHFGQVVQLSQTIPWIGKMGSRGDVELYKAEMQAHTYQRARIELALRTCRLFDRWYVIARALEYNHEHQALVSQLARAIEAQYATGKGTLYDPLQIEVTRTHLVHEAMVLRADADVVRAQLNALLHRGPDAALPPPPKRLPASRLDPSQDGAEDAALAARPELRGAQAEQGSIVASIDLAQRDYVPDFTIFGSYNSMWSMLSHQFMFGISAPLPVVVDRRAGAESAARANLRENEHKQAALTDQVRAEVYEARVRLREARHVAELYRERLIPLADKQAEAVRPAFASGDVSFAEVLAAERGRWTVKREWHEAMALVHTREAELERAMGRVPGLAARGDR